MGDLVEAGSGVGAPPDVMEPGTLVDHVRRELTLCGQAGEDPAYATTLVAAVAALMSYGHSGGSMGCAVEQLEVLLRRGTLTELTNDPAEWIDRSEQSGHPMWQSVRCPAAFSEDGGKTFWLLPNLDGMTIGPVIGEGRLVGVRSGRRFWYTAPCAGGRR